MDLHDFDDKGVAKQVGIEWVCELDSTLHTKIVLESRLTTQLQIGLNWIN